MSVGWWLALMSSLQSSLMDSRQLLPVKNALKPSSNTLRGDVGLMISAWSVCIGHYPRSIETDPRAARRKRCGQLDRFDNDASGRRQAQQAERYSGKMKHKETSAMAARSGCRMRNRRSNGYTMTTTAAHGD